MLSVAKSGWPPMVKVRRGCSDPHAATAGSATAAATAEAYLLTLPQRVICYLPISSAGIEEIVAGLAKRIPGRRSRDFGKR